MIDQTKLIHLIDRTIGSKGQKLKKQNEYMYWSPFVSHHKPKLQVNIQTGKWHCWVSNQGGHNLFQLLKATTADRSLFKELSDSIGGTFFVSEPDTKPVSYTHLRAHETPEHVVWRVLR